MAGRHVPKRLDWRVADGVRIEELDGSWLALDPAGGVVYRLEARAAEVMRLVADRLPLPGHLVPAARDLAGHGVLEHPLVDRRTALVGAGVVTLTGLAATLLPSATAAASAALGEPNSGDWPVSSSSFGAGFATASVGGTTYYFHSFTAAYNAGVPPSLGTLTIRNTRAIADVSLLILGGGGGGGNGGSGGGGGGGAGQLLRVTGGVLPEPSGLTSYVLSIRVGAAGTGATGATAVRGGSGADTIVEFVSNGSPVLVLTAKGGGGGGAGGGSDVAGLAGGSTGGSGATAGGVGTVDGVAAGSGGTSAGSLLASFPAPATTNSAAYGGGSGASASNAPDARAGGGGGAGGAGGAGGTGLNLTGAAGDGGPAVQVTEFENFGASGWFGGGGGGAAGGGSPLGAHGLGGGGGAGIGGSSTGQTGASASSNTGSGGGGGSGSSSTGGAGASGVVLLRYRLA